MRVIFAFKAKPFFALLQAFAGMLLLPALQALAVPFTPGNIIGSSNNTLLEYTPTGTLVQQISVPAGGGGGGSREIMIDKNGNLQIYNGTFTPVLSQYDSLNNVFTHQPGGFSTVNNLSYGSVSTGGDFAFVTDMNTNGSSDSGLVRYNLTGGSTVRFGSGIEYIDVAYGHDGIVYGLRGDGVNGGGNRIDKFDPLTGAHLGTVFIGTEQRGIAVDSSGHIFAAGGNIVHYDPTGQVIKTKIDPIGGLIDIDLDYQGKLVIANHGGGYLFTTTELNGHTVFNYRNTTGANFVAWVLPEPSAGLLVIGAFVFSSMRHRG